MIFETLIKIEHNLKTKKEKELCTKLAYYIEQMHKLKIDLLNPYSVRDYYSLSGNDTQFLTYLMRIATELKMFKMVHCYNPEDKIKLSENDAFILFELIEKPITFINVVKKIFKG